MPEYWNDVQIMENFGWTEKQLKTENTIWMLERIKMILAERGRKEKADLGRQRAEVERAKHRG